MIHLTQPTCSNQTNSCSTSAKLREKARWLVSQETAFIHTAEFDSLTLDDVNHFPEESSLYSEPVSPTKRTENTGAALYRMQVLPLLSSEGERYLFRKLNYYKYRVNSLRSCLDLDEPDVDVMNEIEFLLLEADNTRNHIAECNLRLVNSIVRRFANTENDFEEMASEANMILIKTVDKFDYSKGFRFSTYATHSIQRHLYRWCKTRQRRQANEYATDIDQVQHVTDKKRQPASRLIEKGSDLFSRLHECLNEREVYIIESRFGVSEKQKSRTLRDIAVELGLSKERVRQIQVGAIAKLKEFLKGSDLQELVV